MPSGEQRTRTFRGPEYAEFADALFGPLDRSNARENSIDPPRAVLLADTLQATELQFLARLALAKTALENGTPDQVVVAMAWCVAAQQEDPELHRASISIEPAPKRTYMILGTDFLTILRDVTQRLHCFPEFSRDLIDRAHAQVEEIHLESDRDLAHLYLDLAAARRDMGDREESLAHRESSLRVLADGRGQRAECRMCYEIEYLIWDRDFEGVAAIDPGMLDRSGKGFCRSYVENTSSKLMLPLCCLGRHEEAIPYHWFGLSVIPADSTAPYPLWHHSRFLAMTGNFESAWQLSGRLIKTVRKERDLRLRMFGLSVWRDVAAVAQAHGGPSGFTGLSPLAPPGDRSIEDLDTADLERDLSAEISSITARFDARNGNRFVSNHLDELRDLAVKHYRRLPVSPPKASGESWIPEIHPRPGHTIEEG